MEFREEAAPGMTPDTTRCPACGEPNRCGIAAGGGPCWCFTAAVPPAALDRVPPQARERICLCAACATGQPPSPGGR